jgi:hypothetical protein
MKVEDLITDNAISIAFDNTNFGGQPFRDVISENLKNVSLGYSIGRTAKVCLNELGLIFCYNHGEEVTNVGLKYLEILESSN